MGVYMFWLMSAALVGLVLVALVVPFLRRPGRALARAEYDLAIYKDQLSELDDDEASGLITSEEAAAARNEISRRILAADSARQKASEALTDGGSAPDKAIALVFALLLVPAIAIGLYMIEGRPGMPDFPRAERLKNAMKNRDMPAMIANVEERLARNPKDVKGWLALGPVYAEMGRFDKAANAYERAIALIEKPSADLYNAYGEALVYANRGKIGPKAREAFGKALRMAPKSPMSRYFLAQADLQDGRKDKALAALKALLADLPKEFEGRKIIARQIDALEGENARRKPVPGAPSASSGKPASSGPSTDAVRERMAAAKDMTPQQRNEMIRGMVEGLAARLAKNPMDLPGWLRLINAWSVLGEKDKARKALEDARKAFAGDTKAAAALDGIAEKLSL